MDADRGERRAVVRRRPDAGRRRRARGRRLEFRGPRGAVPRPARRFGGTPHPICSLSRFSRNPDFRIAGVRTGRGRFSVQDYHA